MSNLYDVITPVRADAMRPLDEDNFPQATFEDSGGLGEFHVNHDAEEVGANRSKLYAGVAIALLVCAAGAYGITQYINGQPMVADSHLPQPTAPVKSAAMTPPPMVTAPDNATPAQMQAPVQATPAAPDMVKPAPVTKQARVSPEPRASQRIEPVTVTPAQQIPATQPAPVDQSAAAAPQGVAPPENQAAITPDPISPTPPATSQAGNPPLNQQSAPDETPAAPEAQPLAPTAPAAAPEAPATAQ